MINPKPNQQTGSTQPTSMAPSLDHQPAHGADGAAEE
jgi:hypothetical protein